MRTDDDYVAEARRRLALLDSTLEDRPRRIFVTLSGAHRFGFPSIDSDYDLRGVFIPSTRRLFGLDSYRETIEHMGEGPMPDDVVLQEARKFALLLRKGSGSALEQVTSPLVVETSAWHAELAAIAPHCVTVHSLKHYRGFFASQLSLMRRRPDKEVKILLYIFRVLMTALHLARTGRIEANIVALNEHFGLPFIDELIEQKVGREHGRLPHQGPRTITYYEMQYERLYDDLETAMHSSTLSTDISEATISALDDWLVRLRIDTAIETTV